MKRNALPQPSPLCLATLAAKLATKRLSADWRQNSVAVNHAKHQPSVSEALKFWWECKYLIDQTPPQNRIGITPDECALLAIEFVHGLPMRNIDLGIVVTSALQLWQKCQHRLSGNPELDRVLQAKWEGDQRENAPLKKFPISVKTATKRWLARTRPKSRWPDRIKWFRGYLIESFMVKYPAIARGDRFFTPAIRSQEEAERLGEEEFKRLMKDRVCEMEYRHCQREFPQWVERYLAQERQKKSSKGGLLRKFNITLKAAQAGDARAQVEVGILYGEGRGVDTDYDAAANWFRKAAEQNSPHALLNLAQLYEKGLGVRKSPEKAKKLRELARVQSESQSEKNSPKKPIDSV